MDEVEGRETVCLECSWMDHTCKEDRERVEMQSMARRRRGLAYITSTRCRNGDHLSFLDP